VNRTPPGPPRYPLVTIAAYGPDNTLATKLVAAVFKRSGQKNPELHRWISNAGDVRKDPTISAEVAAFLRRHGVKQASAFDRIIGCPHEEGVDYPLGETCPQCPFWQNRDRFTHEPKTSVAPPKAGRNDPCPCGSGKKFKKCCGNLATG
jgi:hypothetical protein